MSVENWDEEKLAKYSYIVEQDKLEERMNKLKEKLEEFYRKVNEMVANINEEFKDILPKNKKELNNIEKSDTNTKIIGGDKQVDKPGT